MTNIVIIGGGAGGLELATKLGRKLGKSAKATITLVDKNRTHLWKPLLHEVATGALDAGIDALSYRAHAKNHYFNFQQGTVNGLDRDKKELSLAPITEPDGQQILPERHLSYDLLVFALGSVSNDFNTPGAQEHCIFLDNPQQAHKFHHRLLNQFLHLGNKTKGNVKVAIVGAGATGVELSAELHNTLHQLRSYGYGQLHPEHQEQLQVSLIEAGDTILPALPERISLAAHHELRELGVDVRTRTMITEVSDHGFLTKDGDLIEADLMVWAAGIKCADFMRDIGGLETNRLNQLVVNRTLQTSRDPAIFALGDCASCILDDGNTVPPRAQAAHQMATRVYKNILALEKQQPLGDYHYQDHGSLVSLSKFSTVGSLMGNLMRGSMMIEGRLARVVYISLYRMHQVALHGYMKTLLMTVVGKINRVLRPKLKMH